MQRCKHYYIDGKVQGVFYRNSTQRKALSLDIRGWVKNLADGRVEVVASGDNDALDQFEEWLWVGPQYAEVVNIESFAQEYQHFAQFSVR